MNVTKRERGAILAAALSFALAAPAYVQAGAPPKPDLAPMTYFVGLWTCKHTKNPDPKLVGTTFSFAGATDADGYWEAIDTQNGRIDITFDASAGQWVWIYLGTGGDYTIMKTPGWSGNVLTLREVAADANVPLGEARFEKLSDFQYRATYTARTSAGVELFENICTRA